MAIRKNIITFATFLFTAISFGQTKIIDEKIGEAMNGSDWAGLRELYISEGKNLQTPFLHPLSKFFISQFYNKPDSAIKHGNEILEKYQDELSSSVPSILYFMAEDYASLSHYGKASSLLHSLNEAYRQAGRPVNPIFEEYEDIYSKFSDMGSFTVSKPNHDVFVPLSVHKNDNNKPEMLYVTANFNGNDIKCNYDTGAGINIMTPEFAKRIGAKIIPTKSIQMSGISHAKSEGLVVLDSLRLGEVVYRKVPFIVVDMTTDNSLANKKLKELDYSCVIGSQTMMPLGEIRFDFEKMQLIIPASCSPSPKYAPNFYRSSQHGLHLSLIDGLSSKRIDALIDTGASGSLLTYRYYKKSENLFDGKTATDSLRSAGVGGVSVVKTIPSPWSYTISGKKYDVTSIPIVVSPAQNEDYDCLMGLPLLMSHKKFVMNFNEMWIRFDD